MLREFGYVSCPEPTRRISRGRPCLSLSYIVYSNTILPKKLCRIVCWQSRSSSDDSTRDDERMLLNRKVGNTKYVGAMTSIVRLSFNDNLATVIDKD
jgi:hypothetical protein